MDIIIFKPEFLWLTIITLAALSGYTAIKLSRYISILVKHTKLGGGIAGLVIISAVSSLPELVTVLTSTVNNKPSLALADIIGANALSGTFIAVTFIFFFKKSRGEKISKSNIIATILAIIIYVIIGTTMALRLNDIKYIEFNIGLKFGLPLLLITLIYFLMVFLTKSEDGQQKKEDKLGSDDLLKPISTYALYTIISSIFLVGVSIILTLAADRASGSDGYNLGHAAAGALILAMITSIPEIVSLIFLTKLGMRNLAIGGVIGSHVFNFMLLFIGELVLKNSTIIDSVIVDNKEDFLKMFMLVILLLFIVLMLLFNFVYDVKKSKTKLYISYIIIGTYVTTWILINVMM